MRSVKISKSDKTKGNVLIYIGAFGVLMYIVAQFSFENVGRGGFIVLLIAVILITEGNRIKKGKKSKLFDPNA